MGSKSGGSPECSGRPEGSPLPAAFLPLQWFADRLIQIKLNAVPAGGLERFSHQFQLLGVCREPILVHRFTSVWVPLANLGINSAPISRERSEQPVLTNEKKKNF